MEIDNFEKILSMISWDSTDHFYFLQIIKRRKDNPSLSRDMKLIDTFLISSEKSFLSLIPRIKEISLMNNARAYIWINKRSYKKCALRVLSLIADQCASEEYRAVNRAYHSVCGQYHSDPDKKWVVDLDGDYAKEPLLSQIEEIITELQKKTQKAPYIERIPTLNGVHLITRPFDLKGFKSHEICKEISLHKNSPTLAFFSSK